MNGRKKAVVLVLIAALIASVLAYPASEGFLAVENALANRFGNAGYGKFDQSYDGGWIVNGYPGIPDVQHRSELDQ